MSASAGAGARQLYLPADTVIHRLPGHVKLVAAFGFVVAVVATPAARFWLLGLDALLIAAVAGIARIPPSTLLRRMSVEVPFVVFALLMPLLSAGPRTRILGVAVSVDGLHSAGNILAKATLGVVTSIVLAATTQTRDLLEGLERLRTPTLIVQITSFMVRYVDLVIDDAHRMRVARESRGFVARDLRQAPVVARSAAALFVRVYERGERVHLAMLSRGYAGRPPRLADRAVTPLQWATALSLPLAAVAAAVTLS